MAYKKAINSECNASLCGSDASYRVFNNKNSVAGEFCKRHADKRVRELKRAEEAVEAARRPIPTSVRIPR